MHVVDCKVYLYKERYGLHAGDLSSVYRISGHDVKRSCAALYNFLHAYTILIRKTDGNKSHLYQYWMKALNTIH